MAARIIINIIRISCWAGSVASSARYCSTNSNTVFVLYDPAMFFYIIYLELSDFKLKRINFDSLIETERW